MKQLLIPIILMLLSVVTLDISAQELSRFPGFLSYEHYQDNVKISKKQFKELISQSKTANVYWKKASRHRIYSYISFVGLIGFTEWYDYEEERNPQFPHKRIVTRNDKMRSIASIFGIGISAGTLIGYSITSNLLQKKAILHYNEEIDPRSTTNIKFGIAPNGIGFVMGL